MCCQDCELIPVQITSLVWGWLSKCKGWSSIGHPFTVDGHVAAGWLLPHVPARTVLFLGSSTLSSFQSPHSYYARRTTLQ